MDSDSTIPATDDFGSRFMEMDEFDDDNYEILSEQSPESTPTRFEPVKRTKKRADSPKNSAKRQSNVPKKNRPMRQSRRPPARVTDTYTGSSDSDSESISVSTPMYSARSRTRMSYQGSQNSFWTLEDIMADPQKAADNGAASEIATTLTPEQLEIRQRRIERRRESAKNKAEKEMQETVERLLRVNTEYVCGSGNGGGGRGRSRRTVASAEAEFDSENSEREKSKKNFLHPSLSLDPPAGSVRFISSLRLHPHCIIALPAGHEVRKECHFLLRPHRAPPPPKPRLCQQCHVAPRRYACSRTGRSLCSLECFKAY